MKTILIPAQVPDWAKWVAQDAGGVWAAYSREPHPVYGGAWSLPAGGTSGFLCKFPPNPNWRETLREVE